MEEQRHPKHVLKAAKRLSGGKTLRRTFSASEEAQEKGGGYLYSIYPGDRKFPTVSGRYLIENGLVRSNGDGLFVETTQSYSLCDGAL